MWPKKAPPGLIHGYEKNPPKKRCRSLRARRTVKSMSSRSSAFLRFSPAAASREMVSCEVNAFLIILRGAAGEVASPNQHCAGHS